MRKVRALIEEVILTSPDGDRLGVAATCSRCRAQTESYGRADRSVRRCLALLREECPRGERNYYVHTRDEEVASAESETHRRALALPPEEPAVEQLEEEEEEEDPYY